ncbi:hypothetical protein [Geochorda subterranea]|uniref:NitT/TauT family transport system ATP-binding protein n=1 Tax=Geochorda subterranea TaxID=3109564 RepID=A0ABZ1BSR7_9FIRM|nr:hypothetical protein [Limnochorda sp. LNt]WRP15571.1 hypothetical protein VLY81_05260 [Limnochorda sp. LNt]
MLDIQGVCMSFPAPEGGALEVLRDIHLGVSQGEFVLFVTHQIDEAVYLSDRVVVLSARPGAIKAIVDVPLPRPRALGIKRSEPFGRLVDEIWGLIEEEVRRAMRLAAS